jgi:hypothetical protein
MINTRVQVPSRVLWHPHWTYLVDYWSKGFFYQIVAATGWGYNPPFATSAAWNISVTESVSLLTKQNEKQKAPDHRRPSLLQNSLQTKLQQPNSIAKRNTKITRNRVNPSLLGVFRKNNRVRVIQESLPQARFCNGFCKRLVSKAERTITLLWCIMRHVGRCV